MLSINPSNIEHINNIENSYNDNKNLNSFNNSYNTVNSPDNVNAVVFKESLQIWKLMCNGEVISHPNKKNFDTFLSPLLEDSNHCHPDVVIFKSGKTRTFPNRKISRSSY